MREIIHGISEFLKGIIEDYGLFGLFFVVFTESFIQPIPVDPLIIASANTFNLQSVFFVVLFGVMLGSATGYLLGKYLGEPVFIKIFGKEKFEKGHKFIEKWGFWGVVIAGITPIPYKILTWLAGIFEMNFWTFQVAAIIGRMPRFVLMYYIGENLFKLF